MSLALSADQEGDAGEGDWLFVHCKTPGRAFPCGGIKRKAESGDAKEAPSTFLNIANRLPVAVAYAAPAPRSVKTRVASDGSARAVCNRGTGPSGSWPERSGCPSPK